MPKKIFTFTGLLLFAISSYAQDTLTNTSTVPEPTSIIRFSILTPDFQLEQTIARNTTLVFILYAGFSFLDFTQKGIPIKDMEIYPGFGVQPRFYTNLEYRRDVKKETDCYSGTYIGIPISVFMINDFGVSGGIVGGFQKKLGERGFWNIALGVGVLSTGGKTNFVPLGDLSLGFILR